MLSGKNIQAAVMNVFNKPRLIGLVVFLLFVCAPVFAQETSGQLKGTVVDAQGAVVAGATVRRRLASLSGRSAHAVAAASVGGVQELSAA